MKFFLALGPVAVEVLGLAAAVEAAVLVDVLGEGGAAGLGPAAAIDAAVLVDALDVVAFFVALGAGGAGTEGALLGALRAAAGAEGATVEGALLGAMGAAGAETVLGVSTLLFSCNYNIVM